MEFASQTLVSNNIYRVINFYCFEDKFIVIDNNNFSLFKLNIHYLLSNDRL
jgi:hypothetical protein